MGFLAMILGPLMRMLYQMIPNFAVTMIVFTVIIKLLMLPLMIKQQKSMAKMSVFTPMINEIQQKYKNNQEKMQEEMLKFQQEYGYSPTAGCLPMLVNMLVLFGMVEVVYRPVQYILGIPKDAISAACTALGIANNGAAAQTGLIEAIHAGLASGVDTGLATEQLSSIANFNTSFLGMDMCTIPGFSFSLIMIFPIIAAVTMCISQVLSTKMSGQQAQMQGSMKVMMWGMNIMFVFMCFQMPVGFSLYYGTSNIFMMLQTVLTYKVYNPEKFKAQYEAEVAAKRAAKKEIKTVTVEEGGKKVEKNVNKRQLDQMRLEYARKLDAEKYANDRTVPLTDEQRAEMEAQKAQKGKKKKYVGFSLYYGTSNIFMMLQTVLTYKVYNPEKFKAQYEAEVAAKRAAKKEIKTVTVEEGGKKVEKNVNKRQLDQMRLEYARKLDAEKYANDRTVPLTDEQRAEMEAQKAQKGKKKK